MAALLPTRRSADAAARMIVPAAIVIVAVLLLILASIHRATQHNNAETLEMQRALAHNALTATLGNLETALVKASGNVDLESASPSRFLALVTNPDALEAFDAVGLVDAGATPTISSVRLGAIGSDVQGRALDAVAQAIGRLRFENNVPEGPLPQRAFRFLPETRLVIQAGQIVMVALSPLGPDKQAAGHTSFGVRFLDAEFLSALAGRFGGRNLRIVAGATVTPATAAIPLFGKSGEVDAALIWEADLPSDRIMRIVNPVLAFAAMILLMFSLFALYHMRGILKDVISAEAKAKHAAAHDSLTGLANRISFMDRLRRELARLERAEKGLAVVFIDLDKFKEINDSLGHPAGDQLLVDVGKRLAEQLRGTDTLARLGGDEFAIVQTQVQNARDAETLARRLLDSVREPFEIAGAEAYIGLSIGIAMAPENSSNAEDLMRFADVALYRSKTSGRNRFSFFENSMDEAVRIRKLVEDDLRTAIEEDHLRLVYQPQVSADGTKLVSVEALVRWHHPTQGLISPLQFISIAEERGLIGPLGDWVLRKACEDGRQWGGLTVGVNVSAIQFKQRDFVAGVGAILKETGFTPTNLEIELTESVVVDDADKAEEAMMELRAMGIRLALDDFGTGYSSLIYLRRFAFDKIKIDKSFLESMEATGESAILVHSVVHLGRALGLTVTAEGVETDEQHRFLQAVGCHLLQGYYFSKPVPASEITRMIACGRVGPAIGNAA
jgi:diguanylate cyclase